MKKQNERNLLRRRMYDDETDCEPSWVGPVSFICGMVFVILIEAIIKSI